MKTWVAGYVIGLAIAVCCEGQESAEAPTERPAAQETAAPSVSAADKASVKKVLVLRHLRMRDDAARLTRENSEAALALAQQLQAPAELVRLLQAEVDDSLQGRSLYEHRTAFNEFVGSCGVDELQIRLYMESLPYTTEELSRLLEWLPQEHLFNLVPPGEPEAAAIRQQLAEMAQIYKEAGEAYADITNREQADAAAEKLLPLLARYDATLQARLIMLRAPSPEQKRILHFLVEPVYKAYVQQRLRLMETDYYGSRKLASVDYLLN